MCHIHHDDAAVLRSIEKSSTDRKQHQGCVFKYTVASFFKCLHIGMVNILRNLQLFYPIIFIHDVLDLLTLLQMNIQNTFKSLIIYS